MKQNDKIEVFILTYNRKRFLEEAIRSVMAQTVKTKLTVVDNHSTDGTETVIEGLKKEGFEFDYIRRAENGGYAGNFSTAKEHFTFPYIMLFHDDDVLHPQYLEAACAALDQEPDLDLISSGYYLYKDGLPRTAVRYDEVSYRLFDKRNDFIAYGYVADIARDGENVNFPSVIYRKEALLAAVNENEQYGKMADIPFIYNRIGEGKVAHVAHPMFWYRSHPGADSHSAASGCTLRQIFNLNKIFKSVMLTSELGRYLYTMSAARKLKAFSNLGRSSVDFVRLWCRGLCHGDLTIRSFLLVVEFVLMKKFVGKTRMPLHNRLWNAATGLYRVRTIRLKETTT